MLNTISGVPAVGGDSWHCLEVMAIDALTVDTLLTMLNHGNALEHVGELAQEKARHLLLR